MGIMELAESVASEEAPRSSRVAASGARVRSLGYVIVGATDLPAWSAFAGDLLGLQVSVITDDTLELRMDEKEYRLVVNKAEQDSLQVIGWEVGGPDELEELSSVLRSAGYETQPLSAAELKSRRVSGGVSFDDPDGLVKIELHYGLRESTERFVSQAGAQFVTGAGGLGHVFQSVVDWEGYRHLYFDLLGFSLSDHIEAGPTGEVDLTFLHCNPRHHSYAFATLPGVGPAIGHLMFEASELDIVGRAWDKVLEKDAAPILSTLGKHTNDKMISFYVRCPSNFGIEYGTGGILIDEVAWTPTRYSAAHYWGHARKTPVDPTDAADNS